ncbi:hypothetical protein LCGC14_3097060, partial [marine sediment metagenome]
MKQILYVILLIFSSISGFSQDDGNPVKFSQDFRKISDTEYELIMKADIFEGWHVYSQKTDAGGSLPSEFTFKKAGEDYELIGETVESETIIEYSDVFEVDETFFKDEAIFTQRIKLLNPDVNQVNVNLFYQVCKEVCIPADYDFSFVFDGSVASGIPTSVDERSQMMGSALQLDLQNKTLLNNVSDDITVGSGLWKIFGLGFLGGLIALLTPCVFPMIPLTVSFFTKHSEKKS